MEVLELLSANRNISNVLLKNYPGLAHSRSFSQPLSTTRHPNAGTGTLPIDIALSPNNPEHEHDGLARTKSRRIRNEQAFLTWLKQDENVQHPKDVRMMMVSRLTSPPPFSSSNIQNYAHFSNFSASSSRSSRTTSNRRIFERSANASTFINVSRCYAEHQSVSFACIIGKLATQIDKEVCQIPLFSCNEFAVPGHLPKFDDNHCERENAVGTRRRRIQSRPHGHA